MYVCMYKYMLILKKYFIILIRFVWLIEGTSTTIFLYRRDVEYADCMSRRLIKRKGWLGYDIERL